MAGEAILGAILEKLGSFALEEINLFLDVKEEVEKLKTTIGLFKAVISDAENKQDKVEPVRNWLNQLKDLVYEADDILDEYAYDDLMHQHEGLNHMRDHQVHSFSFLFEPIRSFFSKSSNLLSSGHEIKDLNQKFDELESLRVKLGLQVVTVDSSSHTMGVDGSHRINHRETIAFVDKSKVLGRKVDKSNIIKMLLANNSSSNRNDKISVIPIVGMGGLGKTTLAGLVYNDNVVEKHFELRIWVCVSDVFDVQKLFIKIIESLPGNKIDIVSNLNVNVQNLQQRLVGKKFLLVLDDVWNEEVGKWNTLKEPLVVGAEGSKILVTTRSETVARIVRAEPYKLQKLGDDICWSIFEQRAFGPSCEAIKTSTLVKIGKQLVKKCDGLPLALEALGSLMSSKKEVREWEVIRDSKIWDNNLENPNKILPALKLSYDHLLPQVKPCFSYCSMFPKDSEIERETLIRLWVAEGFIQPFEGRLMEEIGYDYFNNLLWNSFFQGVRTNKDGEITKFKMHDLIHDLAQSVAGTHEFSIMEAGEMRDISNFRRLILLNANEESSAATVVSKSKLRTLFIQGRRIKDILNSVFNNNKRLRVLDLSGSYIKELPPSIGDLKHLRYLDLSYCYWLENLPDSITRLYNLQTLLLNGCSDIKKYPKDLNKLINLRHLSHHYMNDWLDQVGQLTCLQTLNELGHLSHHYMKYRGYDEGSCDGDTCWVVGGAIGQLQCLNQLGGKLRIDGLEWVIGRKNAEKANLEAKKYIKEMKLDWGGSGVQVREDEDEYNNHSLVLEGLQPHPNLRTLRISRFMGLKFPTWMSNLQNLVHLQLWLCNRCEQLPALGVLPSLRFLGIDAMMHLEEWQLDQPLPLSIVSFSSYPSLERIEISGCPKLKSMPTKFFSLKEFDVRRSNGMGVSSIVRSNLDTLTKLDIWEVDGLEFLPQGLLKGNNILESLEIRYCPDFKGFNREEEEEEEGDEDLLLLSSSSLHTLRLSNCPNLTLLPGNLRGLTSLRELVVKNCESIELCPILKSMLTGFPSMEKLDLRNDDNGIEIERWYPWYFSIENTPGLMFLPLGLLKGNNVLSIINCPDFQGFIQEEEEGDEDLSVVLSSSISLRKLYLSNCPVLRLLPDLKDLTSLEDVTIQGCNKDLVISLPNGVKNQGPERGFSVQMTRHRERGFSVQMMRQMRDTERRQKRFGFKMLKLRYGGH